MLNKNENRGLTAPRKLGSWVLSASLVFEVYLEKRKQCSEGESLSSKHKKAEASKTLP
jgi:hypothetical protein